MAETDLLSIMSMMDSGQNMLGTPLSVDARARIFACVNDPTHETWGKAHSLFITGGGWGVTLWEALLRHTDYDVASKPLDGTWPSVPTREQILTALHTAMENAKKHR
jgi:hypothetical protein